MKYLFEDFTEKEQQEFLKKHDKEINEWVVHNWLDYFVFDEQDEKYWINKNINIDFIIDGIKIYVDMYLEDETSYDNISECVKQIKHFITGVIVLW